MSTTSFDDAFVEPPVVVNIASKNDNEEEAAAAAESETASLLPEPPARPQAFSLVKNLLNKSIFCADYSPKRGNAKCKRCVETCEKGKLRIGRKIPNPFSESGGTMTYWYHANCIFEYFKRARPTTRKIEEPAADIKGWEDILEEDKKMILGMMPVSSSIASKSDHRQPGLSRERGCDTTLFASFCDLCTNIAKEQSYNKKTQIVSKLLSALSSIEDLGLWIRLLLPGELKRIYNIKSKQLVKLFGQLLEESVEDMTKHLDMSGDVAGTIAKFYGGGDRSPANRSSKITLREVDEILATLEGKTKKTEQLSILGSVVRRELPPNELEMFVRLIEGDLRINAGPKHILDAVHKNAHATFQITRDIDMVLKRAMAIPSDSSTSSACVSAAVLTPVKPMLAKRCASIDSVFNKNQTIFSEIKYDGERVQIHKKGDTIKYYSRSLKPITEHKIKQFYEYLPMAFPESDEYILDSELVMVCSVTGEFKPFGSLGKKKMGMYKDANSCLFVFDLLFYNGEDLMNRTMRERREMLEKIIVEQKNRVMLSKMVEINCPSELNDMALRVLGEGLEGLVLKETNSKYEPGMRHWLKVKKDSIHGGAMADTMDLVVLGSWYGNGKNGGKLSVFLMGCRDEASGEWRTVVKVHTGHTDATLTRLQTELMPNMMRYNNDTERKLEYNLKLDKKMKPDFVVIDPKKSPVWEITGAEITRQLNQNHHTANGISIRFPRIRRERNDKTWETATSLKELIGLYDASVSINKRKVEEKNDADSEAKKRKKVM